MTIARIGFAFCCIAPLLAVAVVAVSSNLSRGIEQTSSAPAGGLLRGGSDELGYMGSRRCIGCHSTPAAGGELWDDRPVCGGEADIWLKQDRHSRTYEALSSKTATAMEKALQWPAGSAVTRRECLTCHSVWKSTFRPESIKEHEEVLKLGVSCEACHGPAEKYYALHDFPAWRNRPLAERQQDFGMFNLRDPAVRSNVCLSCHIGNVEQGKVLTHEMYAAGHPPLGSFELSTFEDRMPKHWENSRDRIKKLGEQSPAAQALRSFQSQLGESDRTLPELKTVVVGALATLRHSAEFSAQTAEFHNAVWPDFAFYDCASCHHELRYPAWRQLRGNSIVPGRPQSPFWPQALVKLSLAHATGYDAAETTRLTGQYEQLLRRFQAAYNSQPFGDRRQIVEAAHALNAWLDQCSMQLNRSAMDKPSALKALQSLCTIAASEDHDVDSARQIARAFSRVFEAVQAEIAPDKSAAIRSAVENLNRQLQLTGTNAQAGIEASRNYRPQQFRAVFTEIARILVGD